jgi:putative chitinase
MAAMPINITDQDIQTLAPSARSSYRQGFGQAQDVLARFGISDNALRVAHFMAQVPRQRRIWLLRPTMLSAWR